MIIFCIGGLLGYDDIMQQWRSSKGSMVLCNGGMFILSITHLKVLFNFFFTKVIFDLGKKVKRKQKKRKKSRK